MLQSHGYEVDMFIDPRVALSNFQPRKYSLAVIDFKMHGIDGFELYERLHEMDNQMKCCFMSGSENPEALAKFESKHVEVSPTCFLKKPLSIESFIDIVKRMATTTAEKIGAQTDVVKEAWRLPAVQADNGGSRVRASEAAA